MDNNKDKKTDDILEKLVHINRITKVVKGGRRFGFSALVVVGNQSGKIGIAHAKAKQVPDAIKKAKATKGYIAKRDSYKSIVRQELNANEKMRLQHKVTELKSKFTKPQVTKIKPLQQTGTQFRKNINVPRVGGLGGGGMAASAFRKIIK